MYCFISKYQCTLSFQRGNNLRGTSYNIQRYRVRERKLQTRETLARGEYGGYTPLHKNGKEKNRTTRNIEGLHYSLNSVFIWKMEVFT